MKYEEAIKILDEFGGSCSIDLEYVAAHIAIEALEKQIPKKPHKCLYPKIIKNGVCPHCLQTEDDSANYCRACGQALDWSE